MDGINRTLFEYIEPRVSNLISYGGDVESIRDNIRDFLNLQPYEYELRQPLALEISKDMLYRYSKEELPVLVTKLAEIETSIDDIQPYNRDHICHSVMTFLLGFCIISEYQLEQKYYDFLFQWKLTSLLHDVGFLFELTDDINQRFFESYDKKILGFEPQFKPKGGQYLRKYLGLYSRKPSDYRNALNSINARLQDWKLYVDAKGVYYKMIEGEHFDNGRKRTDSGIVSALLAMKSLDRAYEKENPEQMYNRDNVWSFSSMENQITNVATSIFLHHLELDGLLWDFHIAPLATLLKLCDGLQIWGRPLKNNENGEPAIEYDFSFENNEFIFQVPLEKTEFFQEKINAIRNFPIQIKTMEKHTLHLNM